jgi:tetratricopeptide (TPR) repeat protein
MRRLKRRVVLLCASFLLMPGCAKKTPDPATPAPAVVGVGPPPTEEDARNFAESLTKAVLAGDSASIDQIVHLSDLEERLASDLSMSDSKRSEVLAGTRKGFREVGFGAQIIKATQDGGTYKLLRLHTVDGKPRALFRLIDAAGGLNYHDYSLARFPDGSVSMEDVYIFLTAEPLSRTIRTLMIPALTASKGVKARDEAISSLAAMRRSMQQGRIADAVARYRQLPKAAQEMKPVLLCYIEATMRQALQPKGSEKDYIAAMEQFPKLYPDDACIDFISIDYFVLKNQYDKGLEAIDRVDASIGSDPYLNVIRCNVLIAANQFDKAKAAVDKALKEDPDLQQAYWARITVSLRERSFDETLEWLKKVVQNCNITVEDLTQTPAYSDFVKSPQHAEWKQWYQTNKK